MTPLEAFDALQSAYEARDDARDRAVAEIDRQYAGVIARRVQAFQDVMRREASPCLTLSGTTPSDTGD